MHNTYKIIALYQDSINRVNHLRHLSEEQWRTPIAEDKWSIAEVIGHLILWDKFVINDRLPFIFEGKELPKSPNVHETNAQASFISIRRSKEKTIAEFVSVRQVLIGRINELDERVWLDEFAIGTTMMSLFTYLSGLIEHDEHHFSQIENVLKEKNDSQGKCFFG
ncbi:DinB family protein [Sporosarcina sp. NPDC096371]|uniref:DinB family protein n=1 Tax=Sporosarcina sp. NPDC096371 TaxID=3364530 RepID=UPI0038122EFA